MAKETHSLRNGIITTVAGGLILALILYLFEETKSWFFMFIELLKSIFVFLTAPYALPLWLLFILVGSVLTFIVLIIISWLQESRKSPYRLYMEDKFYGMIWRWNYLSHQVVNLLPFCPTCDGDAIAHIQSGERVLGIPDQNHFKCDNCDSQLYKAEGPLDYFTDKIKREIGRKIRTDTWNK